MNHIAQYRNGLHHQIHHNPCPPIHNFTARFPSPSLGPLPDSVMLPQIVSDGTLHYHNAPLQSFISGTDSRQQQQNDNTDKVSSNHRKQTMIRSFQPGPSPIISTQSPACSTRQEPPSKGPDSSNCNDHNYKSTQSSSIENHQFIQHCESFMSGTDSRQQQQNDNTDKVSSNHRKQTLLSNFQPGSAHIISTQTPSCSTRQESPPKGHDTNNCNDHSYKPSQSSSVENQFIQHCESFISGTDNRQQQQNDNTDKVSSNHLKQTMIRNFQASSAHIISTQTPSCSTRQESPPKGPDSNNCNDHGYKPAQSSSVENQFIQHCDQGAKNCVQCYNLLKGETPRAIIKVMVDAATMTDQEELDQTGNWSLVSNSLPPPNTKVTEYLSNLRQFLKVDHKPHERKRQRQGDVRIVTSPDGSRLYFCPECHAAYPDKNLLEPHLAAHKIERRFICNVCGAGLKRKEHLDRHQLSHSEERPYSCSVCSKTFKRNEHLSRHSIIHSGLKPQERPWVCGVCGAAHIRKEHLERHLLTHTDERPYACPLCPKAFKHNEHLSRHLVIHSGHKTQDRPWVCGVCGRGHARKEHLDRHQVSHSDLRPYSCPSCPKTFKRSEHLSRHLIIHSSQKTELCRECGKMFYRKDHLRKHAESHYKKRNKQPLPNPVHLGPPMVLSSAV